VQRLWHRKSFLDAVQAPLGPPAPRMRTQTSAFMDD
jgi:hypothetical protein